jgi:hypothetical protein
MSRYGVTAMAAPSPPIFRIIVDRDVDSSSVIT